jgi:hypothetical protein
MTVLQRPTAVADLMTIEPVVIGSNARLEEAEALMRDHRVSGLPVVDRTGILVGVISQTDFLYLGDPGDPRSHPARSGRDPSRRRDEPPAGHSAPHRLPARRGQAHEPRACSSPGGRGCPPAPRRRPVRDGLRHPARRGLTRAFGSDRLLEERATGPSAAGTGTPARRGSRDARSRTGPGRVRRYSGRTTPRFPTR